MKLFPERPEDFGVLGSRKLRRFIRESEAAAEKLATEFASLIADGASKEELIEEMRAGVEALDAAREELASRVDEETGEDEVAELAARAREGALAAQDDDGDEGDGDDGSGDGDGGEGEGEGAEPEALSAEAEELAEEEEEPEVEPAAESVVASALPTKRKLAAPARSRSADPRTATVEEQSISLTAAAEGLGHSIGEELDVSEVAEMMIRRRGAFGNIAPGTKGEKIGIARADWSSLYPGERTLGLDVEANMAKIQEVIDQDAMKSELARRREGSLVASGGLCAPVTPYYNLQMISVADRPVRAALAAFNADRGGIRFAAPPALSAITDGVGIKTEAEDAAGGSDAVKSCQIVDCPEFDEVDVDIIYHCLQFGNLGARTFPERVAHFNSLVLAAHARLAETNLLDGISAASTAVTAAGGLGTSADFLSEVLVAAAAMRSRHRMDPDAVLRLLMPRWLLDELTSDVFRGQFQRFEMTAQKFIALLRQGGVEPSFYIDGPTGASQVFGTQGIGELLAFPSTAVWYLYPEGSFLYVDGGTLELGLVRDSVLNNTNDFQIFGETFENVAFIGVESLEVTSTICDSGIVAAPDTSAACPDWGA